MVALKTRAGRKFVEGRKASSQGRKPTLKVVRKAKKTEKEVEVLIYKERRGRSRVFDVEFGVNCETVMS